MTLFPKLELPGMARVSFGLDKDPADIDVLAQALGRVAREGPARRKALKKRMEGFVEGVEQRVYGEGTPQSAQGGRT